MSGQALELRGSDPIALGRVMFASRVFGDVKSAEMAVVKILAGQEFGLGPVAAMTGIHIIDGKPVPAAGTYAGCVKAHPAYDYDVKHHEDDRCVLEFFAVSGGERRSLGESTFTMADAAKAGLAGRANWKRYPRNMLFARALTNGMRWYSPDVVRGVILSKEEAEDIAEDHGPVRVENEAATAPTPAPSSPEPEVISGDLAPTNDELIQLKELYDATGWEDEAETDPHVLLRMTMKAAGVEDPGRPLGQVMQGLTRAQFDVLRDKLSQQVDADIQARVDADMAGK